MADMIVNMTFLGDVLSHRQDPIPQKNEVPPAHSIEDPTCANPNCDKPAEIHWLPNGWLCHGCAIRDLEKTNPRVDRINRMRLGS